MPHSLRAKLKYLTICGHIRKKDYERLCKALDNEGVLDKIRAEILDMMPPLGKWMYEEGHIEEQTSCEVIADVLQIIDKYKEDKGVANESVN